MTGPIDRKTCAKRAHASIERIAAQRLKVLREKDDFFRWAEGKSRAFFVFSKHELIALRK